MTGEGVIDRKLVLCSSLQDLPYDELITHCDKCNHFFIYCCVCAQQNYPGLKPCHHSRVLFTDGACSRNGYNSAVAGMGMAYGSDKSFQKAVPILETMDPGQKRTSQRAELLAAIEGQEFFRKAQEKYKASEDVNAKSHERNSKQKSHESESDGDIWVIATDSEYVVKGMTEWLPAWKV